MLQIEYNFDDYFDIEEVKSHCRVDFDDDNEQLKLFAEAALETCASFINGYIAKKDESESEFKERFGLPENSDYWIVVFSKRVKSAALLIVADLYENRSANTDYNTYENRAFNLLIGPLKNINFGQA